MICDNLLHTLSDLNDTTCPRPLRGMVADLAAFVVAGCYFDSWVVIMTAGGAAGDGRAVRLSTFDIRWRCWLSIYHDRFTCVCVIVLCNFICKCILCLSNQRFLILILIHHLHLSSIPIRNICKLILRIYLHIPFWWWYDLSVLLHGQLQPPVPFRCLKMMEYVNLFSHFLKWIQHL